MTTLTAVTEGLQVREVALRATETPMEVIGIAVPWDEVIDLGYARERFERGAVVIEGDVALFYGHDHRAGGMPIGRVVEARATDEGLEIRALISDTVKGREVHQLLRDGVLTKFSIGFEPVDYRVEDEDVLVHTRAVLKEVSVVPFPAYDGATVSEVRSATTPEAMERQDVVETTDNTEVAELRDQLSDLERKLAVITEQGAGMQAAMAPQFRSGGQMLKALASNDEKARTELRDFGTSVEADVTRPGWISKPLKLVQEKRRVINLFSTAPLPATGNSVEYPFVKTTTGSVGKQNAEGDALAYMEIALDTGTSPVATYGGYSSLSRQSIERSDLAYLDAVLRYQALQYAKSTETAGRTAFLAMTGIAQSFPKLSVAKAKDWINLVIDAAAAIEDTSLGLEADFVYASRDVFKAIAGLTDSSDRPIFALREGSVNTVGAANLVRASANVGGLPVVVDPKAALGTLRVASSEAFTTLESGGAPFRLQDESIVNLTKDFSLYGYLATTANDQGGVVKVTVTPEA